MRFALFLLPFTLSAQLPPGNEIGVAMGHLHLNAKDPAASQRFWVDYMGGKVVKLGNLDVYKFPDVLVMVRKADVSAGSEGTAVNHLGFLVKDLDAELKRCTEAVHCRVQRILTDTRQAFVLNADDVKVELVEDTKMNDRVRHHHIHFFNQQIMDSRAWYAKMFAAKPGKRGKFWAADLPGVNLSWADSPEAVVPTKGRGIDHIGFEVKNLEAFVKTLESQGVKFDVPYRKVPQLGIAVAFFTDPWGAYVELTEGLNKL